jgi:hypothetical protein
MVEIGLLRHYLFFAIFPLWILAGLTDYFLHKRTRIEENAGTRESLLHIAQLGEIGIPLILALLLEINALMFLLMLFGLVLHEITALWDVSYASSRRYVSPLEQHVHSFMEVLPVTALLFVSVLYWSQFAALFGFGPESPRFELRPKANPIPTAYVVTLLISATGFVVFPYAEELWRCIRAAPSRRVRDNRKQVLQPSKAA